MAKHAWNYATHLRGNEYFPPEKCYTSAAPCIQKQNKILHKNKLRHTVVIIGTESASLHAIGIRNYVIRLCLLLSWEDITSRV